MEDSFYCLCEPDDGCTSCFKVDQRFSNVWTFRPGLSSSSSLLCLLLTATKSRPVSFCSLALSHNHTVSSTPPPPSCVLCTSDATGKVPSVENTQLSKLPSFKSGVCQKVALCASPANRNSAVLDI